MQRCKMLKAYWILIVLFISVYSLSAQELNLKLTINSDQIQTTDKSVFDQLQDALIQLVNARKWTDTKFNTNELIQGTILITLKQFNSDDNVYKGEIQISSSRPVYNSTYITPMFNFRDTELEFSYIRGESLEFSENNLTNNLVATVAFYTYIILGFDFDSYSQNGGKPYFEKAMSIAHSSQSLSSIGWATFGSDRNRYALALALTEESSSAFHSLWYNYHRKGLDEMADNPVRGRIGVVKSVSDLQSIYQARPSSVLLSFWSDTKFTEMLDIYTEANSEEKDEAYKILTSIYPTRKYLLGKLKK